MSTDRIHLVSDNSHGLRELLNDFDRRLRTVDEVIADLAVFTDEQRSLAWSPEPRRESRGGPDCRPGGNCGLDFNADSPHAQWLKAKARMLREQRRSHAADSA